MAEGLNIENVVEAVIITAICLAALSPAFFSTLLPSTAQQLNYTAFNSTAQLNGIVFKQTNNTAFCGSATCTPGQTGGLNAVVQVFTGLAFVMQGFGTLITVLLQTPAIMGTLIGSFISQVAFPTTVNTSINADSQALVAFLFVIIGVSAYMKYPLRTG